MLERIIGGGKTLLEKIESINESINNHYGDSLNLYIRIRDFVSILYVRLRYKFENKEYYYYHLYSKSASEIREFCPKKIQANLYFKVNTEAARHLATDKYASYLRFKKYYNRSTVAYNPSANLINIEDQFHSFIESHPQFIVKPLDSNSGKGVKIIDSRDVINLCETLKSDYKGGFIAEELIIQSKELAQFHPQSVNTVRINTFNFGDTIEVKFPSMRMGRGEAVVDNANAGGICGGIDQETGMLIAVGDELGNHYYEHPDTKIPFNGFVLPRWHEVCEIAKEIASKFPECKVIGFDFALTDNGWCLVEINAHPLLIFQIATQTGIMKEMESIIKRMNV